MYLWISGGGTAGHIYPAITVLDALGARVSRVTWIGRAGGMEAALMARRGVPFLAVDSAPMVGVGPVGRMLGAFRLAKGTLKALRELIVDRPDVVMVTGGYVCIPAAIAARLVRVPLAVFLPDARPGRAVALLARIADLVMTTVDDTWEHLRTPRHRVRLVGYPVRPALRDFDQLTAVRHLNLDAERKTLLVFGGSQGARRLNQALCDAAPLLLTRFQIVHVTGRVDVAQVRGTKASLPDSASHHWQVHDYLDDKDMGAALQAADLALCRAGASTLGELPAAGLPAVLVPLPIARGHQDANAAVLVRAGAARHIADGDLIGETLVREVSAILDDTPLLAKMVAAARHLDNPAAADDIADALVELSGRFGEAA